VWNSPWLEACDAASLAPLLLWFRGGLTNAAFNELDRHILSSSSPGNSGSGAGGPALLSEMPGGASTFGASAPTTSITREGILAHSAAVAAFLSQSSSLGHRVAIHMLNGIATAVWIEGCKRAAVPFTASAVGTPSASLAHRLRDFGATVVVASEVILMVAMQAIESLPAVPITLVLARSPTDMECVPVGRCDGAGGQPSAGDGQLIEALSTSLAGLQPSDDAPPLVDGAAMPDGAAMLSGAESVRRCWRHAASAPVEASHPLFVLYTSGSTGKPKGIVHTHGGYEVGLSLTAQTALGFRPLRNGGRESVSDSSGSGSVGGGGAADVLFVVATPGWITGQSYMLGAALLCRVPSVMLEGSPVSPQPDRFAQIIARHRVTVFKTGSTMLRVLLNDANSASMLAVHDLSSLRLVALCAEPVNAAVHRYASERLCAAVANTYWATEHGAIVFGACHGNHGQRLVPDGRTWPLPWVRAEVWIGGEAEEEEEGGPAKASGGGALGARQRRRAADGESGECILSGRPPYMALTVWCGTGFGEMGWRGDAARWASYFDAATGGYVQGDTAVRHAPPDDDDGRRGRRGLAHFSFHGRSDEVMNVGGNRIGTAEIEGALLAAAAAAAEGGTTFSRRTLVTCAVVGRPHKSMGEAPCAFLVLGGRDGGGEDVGSGHAAAIAGALDTADERRLVGGVKAALGAYAVPDRLVVVDALPTTFSGKIARRVLRSLLRDEPQGDLAGLRNPESVEAVARVLQARGLVRAAAPVAVELEATAASTATTAPNGDGKGERAPIELESAGTEPPPTVESLLAGLGLERYVGAMDDEGFETLESWATFESDEAGALEVLMDDLEMGETDARAFFARVKAALRDEAAR
jgi:acrylyl-CoA reductase (NADPH)/3-hydroxypropionyl-CoA dehydratase/3-hydroxypropionyl-CoA synthetase